MSPLDHNYTNTSILFRLPTIMSIHKVNDYLLAWKIIKKQIVCSELSALFHEIVNQRPLRTHRFLEVDNLSQN